MVTLPTIDFGQLYAYALLVAHSVAPRAVEVISDRLAHGNSLEDLFREGFVLAEDTPEEIGLSHLLEAIWELSQERPKMALNALSQARNSWPVAEFLAEIIEAGAFTMLKDYERAFDSYEKSLSETKRWLKEIGPVYPNAHDMQRHLYQRWALVSIAQGLEGLMSCNSNQLASGLRKFHWVLTEAKAGNHESGIWELVDKVSQSMRGETENQWEVFETAMRVISDAPEGPDWIDELARVYITSPGPAIGTSAEDLAGRLKGLRWPDAEFADDLKYVQDSQPAAGEPRWHDC